MSQINATIESNLKLPIVTALPVSGVAGTQFVFENNVYLFNASGAPVRVGKDFAQESFVPTFIIADSGTITTTDSLTVTKSGNLVTVSGVAVLTVGGTLSGAVTIGTVPASFRPAIAQTVLFVSGNDASLGSLPYPANISSDGTLQVFFDPSGLQTGDRTTIIGSWTV